MCALISRFPIDKTCAQAILFPEEEQCLEAIESILISGSEQDTHFEYVEEYYLEPYEESLDENQTFQESNQSNKSKHYNSKDSVYVPPDQSTSAQMVTFKKPETIRKIHDFWLKMKENPKCKHPAKRTIKKFGLEGKHKELQRIIAFYRMNGNEFTKSQQIIEDVREKFVAVSIN